MKILITGATGFIGSRLALHCLAAGHSVRVLGQNRNSAEDGTARMLQDAGAEVVIASVTDPDRLAGALQGIEFVFHLAAAQHEANVPDRHFREVNVEGTRNMLDASLKAGVRRFVHGSSIGVFGWTPGTHVNEDSPLEPENIYGVTKLAGEEVVQSYEGRLDFVILRIPEVYGPGDLRLLKLFRGVRAGKFPMIGRGDNLHHLIYIDDLIEAMMLSAIKEEAGGKTFVVVGGTPVSTKEMVDCVASKLGTTPPRLRIPLGPMLLVARTLETVLRPLGIQPPLHPRRMNFYRKSFAFKGEDARAVLGFRPEVDFEAGAAATAAWYEQQGLLG